ncbi:MAG: hypothetical protein HZLCBSQH_000638 [Candidatus Fervidibacterota bacterium]
MLSLYLDTNTPEGLAKALRAEGFEVVRAQEVGLQDADDLTHLRWASENGYALFTFDAKTMPRAVEEWLRMGSGALRRHRLRADAEGDDKRHRPSVEEVGEGASFGGVEECDGLSGRYLG